MRHLQARSVSNTCNGFAADEQIDRAITLARMQFISSCILCALVIGMAAAHGSLDCWARPYAAPGFLSDRRLFPAVGDPLWNGHNKVAFQNADCTWLAGNFRDTGSQAVMILYSAATIHKESWPNPQLQQQLAVEHNLSSLAVDIAGRGESCGYEIGPGCMSTVILPYCYRWLDPCSAAVLDC